MSRPIIYTLRTCPACIEIKKDWAVRGKEFEERQVDDNQTWLDEAREYGDTVPIVVYGDGRVEVGYADMIGCYII
ncbi:MAG: glutaredoxin domain-containing protein [Dehalococcoidales bacterium]|nr:glutaredoxin domain-containing protein [Dehalococcoidales bacterium]